MNFIDVADVVDDVDILAHNMESGAAAPLQLFASRRGDNGLHADKLLPANARHGLYESWDGDISSPVPIMTMLLRDAEIFSMAKDRSAVAKNNTLDCRCFILPEHSNSFNSTGLRDA